MQEIQFETIVNDYCRQQARIIDETIFDFLRKHGYRPKKTEKYINNLKKKLDKQGLAIKVDEIVLEEKYDNFSYRKRCVYVPSFVEVEKE